MSNLPEEGGYPPGEGGFTVGFVRQRLAKAAALPPEQRTPEVAGFVEACRLLDEAAATPVEQHMERGPGPPMALRLVRADLLSAGPPLDLNGMRHWIDSYVCGLSGSSGPLHQSLQLLASSPAVRSGLRLDIVLATLAALPPPAAAAQQPSLRGVALSLLRTLTDPAVRRRLERQLADEQADLPAPLLTWAQVAGRAAAFAAQCCGGAGGLALAKLCANVLPQLAAAADQPPVLALVLKCEQANVAAVLHPFSVTRWRAHVALLDSARAAGSDLFVARAGFALGAFAYVDKRRDPPPPDSPASVLGWVREAEGAYKRCKPLLPTAWLERVEEVRKTAVAAKAWLEELVEAGAGWAMPSAAVMDAVAAAHDRAPSAVCSGCGHASLHLNACGGCRRVRYCSKECQVAHWKTHKPACKAAQRARAASGAGSRHQTEA